MNNNTNSITELMDLPLGEFERVMGHAVIGSDPSTRWNSLVGEAARGSRGYWKRKSRDMFNDACYSLARTKDAEQFSKDLATLEFEYKDLVRKQRVAFSGIKQAWDVSSLITLTQKFLGNDVMASTYVSYTKDDFTEYLRSPEFEPALQARWKSFSYDVKELRDSMMETEGGQRIWNWVKKWGSDKRVETMEKDVSDSNMSCYYIAQAIYKEATKSQAFWKPIMEWKIDKLQQTLQRADGNKTDASSNGGFGPGLYAGSSEGETETFNQLREAEDAWEAIQDEVHDIHTMCEDFASVMHKVLAPKFAHAHEEISPKKYKAIYSMEEAINIYIERNKDKTMAKKDENDTIVLAAMREAAQLEVIA